MNHEILEAINSLMKANSTMRLAVDSIVSSLDTIDTLLTCMKNIQERRVADGTKPNRQLVIPPKPKRNQFN